MKASSESENNFNVRRAMPEEIVVALMHAHGRKEVISVRDLSVHEIQDAIHHLTSERGPLMPVHRRAVRRVVYSKRHRK